MLNSQLAKTTHPVDDRGFTFVEVLIVIAIFSIGVLAVATLQATAISANASARMSGEATALAVNQVEALMALDYGHADLNPANNPHEVVQGAYTVNWIVTESDIDGDGSNDSKTIFVTVHCANPKAKDVKIKYIISEL
jgi:type IV pilus assembly protein PilV